MKKLILYLIAIIGGLMTGSAVGGLIALFLAIPEYGITFVRITAGLGAIAMPIFCKDIIANMIKTNKRE